MPQYAEFQGFVTLVDVRGHEATRRFDLDKAVNAGVDPPQEAGARYVIAHDALTDIVAELEVVTNATVKRYGVITTVGQSEQLGGAGSDVTDEALLAYYINETGQREKLWTFGIPSPVNAIFEPDLVRVAVANADLADLSAEIAGSAFVSDGEEINTSLGETGLKMGIWRSRQKRGG
jgi:hypothetical protein